MGVTIAYRVRGRGSDLEFDKEVRVSGLSVVDPLGIRRILEALVEVMDPEDEE